MLNNIFLKTLRDQRRSLLMWGGYLVAIGRNHGAFLSDHQQNDRF